MYLLSRSKISFPLNSSTGKLFYSAIVCESELPEFIYAGKNIKPHTRVYAMGVSTHGALGVERFLRPPKGKNIYNYMKRPFRLSFADQYKVADIACGYGFSILAMKNHKDVPLIFGMGINTNSQLGMHDPRKGHPLEYIIVPSQVNIPISKPAVSKKVCCGRAHTLVWTDAEGLWTFGNNSYGQCGRAVIENENYGLNARYHRINQFNGEEINQIECGQDTSFVLTKGQIYSCGWSADGQTGLETYKNVDSFSLVGGDLAGEKAIKISCKADCALALTEKGEVFGWGNSEYRQLSSVSEEQQLNTPRKLTLNIPDKIIDIASSGTACFAVTDSGDVWSWGYGILGIGPNELCSTEPRQIPNTLLGRTVLNPNSKVIKIFTGTAMATAVTSDGGLYSWGRNTGGVLGLGHTNFQHFPMRVCVSTTVKKVSCGVDHMIVQGLSLM